MTLSDWNALSDETQQRRMQTAYESHIEIEIGDKTYSVEFTFDERFALRRWGFLSLIRKWWLADD
jgi:hypothetical protein